MAQVGKMEGQGRVWQRQFLSDYSGTHAIWPRLDQVTINGEPRFLCETSENCDGIGYFHISNNIEI